MLVDPARLGQPGDKGHNLLLHEHMGAGIPVLQTVAYCKGGGGSAIVKDDGSFISGLADSGYGCTGSRQDRCQIWVAS